jgi:4-amino-4-deoxy-L-arabinose transferase-like glycosyltransferase
LLGSVALVYFGLQRRSWLMLLGAGALLGYAILVRPQVLLLPVPIAVYIFFTAGRRRTAALLAGVFLVASFGVVAPWTIRNELRLHAFVPVASYTWFNFWEVNNPQASGHFILPEWTMPAEVRRIRALPEIQQDLAWRQLALTWVRAHPAKALTGWGRDIALYFAYHDPYVRDWYTLNGWRPPRLDERLLYPLIIIAGVFVLLYRRRWPTIWLLVVVAAYFVAFFAVFLPLARYRMPLLPILAIFAAGVPEMVMSVVADRRARSSEAESIEQPVVPALARPRRALL